jgi:hypothetical protein
LLKVAPNDADAAANRTSQHIARFKPAPTAGPLTAAMVGWGSRSTAKKAS